MRHRNDRQHNIRTHTNRPYPICTFGFIILLISIIVSAIVVAAACSHAYNIQQSNVCMGEQLLHSAYCILRERTNCYIKCSSTARSLRFFFFNPLVNWCVQYACVVVVVVMVVCCLLRCFLLILAIYFRLNSSSLVFSVDRMFNARVQYMEYWAGRERELQANSNNRPYRQRCYLFEYKVSHAYSFRIQTIQRLKTIHLRSYFSFCLRCENYRIYA